MTDERLSAERIAELRQSICNGNHETRDFDRIHETFDALIAEREHLRTAIVERLDACTKVGCRKCTRLAAAIGRDHG